LPQAGALRPTAANPLTPSLQIHAEAIEQLLSGSAPVRRSYAFRVEIVAMLLVGLAAATAGLSRLPWRAK